MRSTIHKKKKDPAAVKLGRRGGKVGGLSTSDKKAAAARANGKLGGRPRAIESTELFADLMSLLAALKGDDAEAIESISQELERKYDPEDRYTAPAHALALARKEQP